MKKCYWKNTFQTHVIDWYIQPTLCEWHRLLALSLTLIYVHNNLFMSSCMSFIYVIYVLILYMPILFCCFICGCLVRDDLIKKYKQNMTSQQAWCRQVSSHYLNKYWPSSTTQTVLTEEIIFEWHASSTRVKAIRMTCFILPEMIPLPWVTHHRLSPRWRHQMETFPRYWPFVRGIHRSPVNSPHKGQCDAELWSFLWSAAE